MAPLDQSAPYYGPNAAYIADLYARYQDDPDSVEKEWRDFFGDLAPDAKELIEGIRQNKHVAGLPAGDGHTADGMSAVAEAVQSGTEITAETVRAATLDSIRALMLIRAYRVRGHLEAELDPLELTEREPHPELDPKSYGFTDDDMDRPIFINHVLGLETATLREILQAVRATYCGSIGVEFMHIQEPDQKAWIQERIENIQNRTEFTPRGKHAILERLTAAETFEKFLDKKYTGTKRFGIDGGEATIPALEQILKRGSQLGLEEVVIGMPHRGRLNVLANFMGKPFRAIFSEFQGGAAHPEDVQGSGDVKYHLGTSSDREFDERTIHLSLTANPSHLEAVNPVVVGKVRAKQAQREDKDRSKVMALLMHGDAAFAGQGLVPETLDLSELKGYRIGGTIHFIVNNQIGFTTNPVHARSGPYCSDVAKMIQAPIFHVNGDDPEAVVHVARIATEFRQTFKKDVVIDMFCYRRHGHNEGDEPAFTQPRMYAKIRKHPSTRKIYADKLAAEGSIAKDGGDKLVQEWSQKLEEEFEAATGYKPNKADWLEGAWAGLDVAREEGPRRGETGVDMEMLQEVGKALTSVPDGFNLNRKIGRQLETKKKMFESGEGVDWATAEALAFGTLTLEDTPIRMSGQDCIRGTFSQRHAAFVDQENEKRYWPLNNIRKGQATVEIVESPLSEVSVVGFEYGFSLAEPRALVLWEAQFGDFANGAQIIIDQFITSGESKWLRMSGLTLLLPHGYEGQGPEHSSARMERFLQMCAEDNIQVVNCTTPANYFHVLRRQVKRNFRKPLVIMTPKSLLRHKRCVSPLNMMGAQSTFHRVMYCDDLPSEPKDAKRVVLCSGKVYYDLLETREKEGVEDVHFLRLEQVYPFPADALAQELAPYRHCEIVWCQEEPKNMGAWSFVAPLIEDVLVEIDAQHTRPIYVGRKASASTATGMAKRHQEEQSTIVREALTAGSGPAAVRGGGSDNVSRSPSMATVPARAMVREAVEAGTIPGLRQSEKSGGAKSSGSKSSGSKSGGAKSASSKSTGSKSAQAKRGQGKSAQSKSAQSKSGQGKSAQGKSGAAKSTGRKAAASKSSGSRSSGSKTAASKSSGSKSSGSKSSSSGARGRAKAKA